MSNCNLSLNWKQKILLKLLTLLDDKKYSRLKIFKIAFLLGREIVFYDFVPYKYGAYSFEMDKDLRMFNNNGWITMEENLIYANQHIIKSLSYKINNENKLQEIINKFRNMNENNLLDFVYKKYPFYTQNSLLIKQQKNKKQTAQISIYTIGYQNFSIDLFISVLVEKGIKAVLDVRNKPFSYKYGFNYSWLNKYLPEFGIKYINIPELGVDEKYRKSFPRNQLWEYYSILLEKKREYLKETLDIIKKQPTVLVCYEMNPDDCHRLVLAKKLQGLVNLPIINYDRATKQWKKLKY